MKYKALFLDLDGTTVPSAIDAMPSERVRDAIHRAKSRVFVCIATSRPLAYAKPVIDHLDIRGLCAVNDATQIYDPVKKEIIETIYMNKKDVTAARTFLRARNISFLINTGDGEREYQLGERYPKVCSIAVSDISESLADQIIDRMSDISTVAAHKIFSYKKGLYWVAITHVTATKLHGVSRIAELLGVKTEELVGVGDGYNDYPLLSACGLKIAMGNAAEELKAIADFIAPSVDEDGVAVVIEKFILNA